MFRSPQSVLESNLFRCASAAASGAQTFAQNTAVEGTAIDYVVPRASLVLSGFSAQDPSEVSSV
jgi:hypothetical protein